MDNLFSNLIRFNCTVTLLFQVNLFSVFFDIQRTVHRDIRILIMKANEMNYLSNKFEK